MATTNGGPLLDAASNSDGMTVFGPHVVTLIDFLGQASELAKWDFVPETPEQEAEWTAAVRRSMGRVLTWRKKFEGIFSQSEADSARYVKQAAAGQPAERRRELDEYRQTSLNTAHFSDTLIFCSPLQNEQGYWQVSRVADMIITCGVLMLTALANKTVFRGAIEVGMLGRFPTGDPYGPALGKAHFLEAKLAEYPRIIIGPGLISYLHAILKNPDTGWTAQANRGVAELCQKLISKDADGLLIADYLSDEYAPDAQTRALALDVQRQALAFVQTEHERFVKAGDDELAKRLAKRYDRLLAYFQTRGVT